MWVQPVDPDTALALALQAHPGCYATADERLGPGTRPLTTSAFTVLQDPLYLEIGTQLTLKARGNTPPPPALTIAPWDRDLRRTPCLDESAVDGDQLRPDGGSNLI